MLPCSGTCLHPMRSPQYLPACLAAHLLMPHMPGPHSPTGSPPLMHQAFHHSAALRPVQVARIQDQEARHGGMRTCRALASPGMMMMMMMGQCGATLRTRGAARWLSWMSKHSPLGQQLQQHHLSRWGPSRHCPVAQRQIVYLRYAAVLHPPLAALHDVPDLWPGCI